MLDYAKANSIACDKEQLSRLDSLEEQLGIVQFRLKNSPAGDRIEELSAVLPTAKNVESILATVAELLSPTLILDVLRADIRGYLSSPLFTLLAQPLAGELLSGMLLWDDPRLSITLTSFSSLDRQIVKEHGRKQGPRKVGITFSARDTYFRVLKAGGVRIGLWEAEPIGFDTPIHGNLKCRKHGSMDLHTGSTFFMHGGAQSWSFEETSGPWVALAVACKQFLSPVVAQYNQDTCELESVNAADDKSSRIELLATLLRLMMGNKSCEYLAPLLAHRDHFVRWYVAREMVAADRAVALPYIRSLTQDSHHHVSAAAKATLETIYGEDGKCQS